ncbi:MAG: hypothetical protein QM817_04035 [Archangium sp.]
MKTLLMVALVLLCACSRDRLPQAELRNDGPRGIWFARTVGEHQRRGISVQIFLDDGVLATALRTGDRVDLEGKKDRYELQGTQMRLQVGGTELSLPYTSGTDANGPWFDTGRRFRPLRKATREQLARTWYRDIDEGMLVLPVDDTSWSIDGYLMHCPAGDGAAGLTENDELVLNRQLFRSTPRPFEPTIDVGAPMPQ